LSAAQEQQQALLQQKHKLEQQKMTYSSAIAANPEAEQRLASLTRDYENMMTLYRDLKSRKLAADMNKTIENSQVGQRLIITEPASLPFVTEPSKKFIIACGFILALITGFGSIFTLHYLSGAINGVSHLKSVFGIIPLVRIPKLKKAKGSQNYPKLAANKIVAHQINNKQADIFRFLRTQILQKLKNNKYQSLAISSARYGDGKTTIASNLAVSIAQDLKQTVLLVDLDLRKASLANIFGLNAEVGLTNYLKGDALVKDCLIRPPFERITIFPAGNAIDNSSETIGSPQMEILAKELRERYEDRIIIYDMPPLLQQDDPLVFLPHVDAFLFVVREGVTQASEIERSLDILKKTNLLGVVVNDN
jgi:capsular exopolysaccharide synthesis family protein